MIPTAHWYIQYFVRIASSFVTPSKLHIFFFLQYVENARVYVATPHAIAATKATSKMPSILFVVKVVVVVVVKVVVVVVRQRRIVPQIPVLFLFLFFAQNF
jgi:hypothetical protein